jgi:hypothetical protein
MEGFFLLTKSGIIKMKGGHMKAIHISKGQVVLVSDEDYERVNEYKWYAHESKTNGVHYRYYACRKDWHPSTDRQTTMSDGRVVNGYYTIMRMHRFIIDCPRDKEVDHIDGNGLNNQRENLRIVTRLQNMWNQRTRKTSKSGYKGVSWDTKPKKWRATITVNHKMVNLGRFEEIGDAINARIVAEKKYLS